MAIHGPSGAGKTYTALNIATHMGKVCLVDTETGSASKYGDKFDFDVCEFTGNYHPDRLVEFLAEVPDAGYDVIVIDSMTHFWNGTGGFLELVDAEVKKSIAKGQKADSFNAWKHIDPIYKRMVHAIQTCKAHVIVTLRAKTEYAKQEGANGRTTIKKLGMAPEMRDNFQYEMDVEAMLTIEHDLAIGKTRCDTLDGRVFSKPGKDVADVLMTWLSSGAPMRAAEPVAPVGAAAADDLVRRLEAAESLAEVAVIKTEAAGKRDQLGESVAAVRAALEAATARLKVAA